MYVVDDNMDQLTMGTVWCRQQVDLQRGMHELVTFVRRMTLGEHFNMTAQKIREVID